MLICEHMKYVFFGIKTPDGTERGCLVSYHTEDEFVLLKQQLGKSIQGGTIHTMSINYTREMLEGSVYTRAAFLEIISF